MAYDPVQFHFSVLPLFMCHKNKILWSVKANNHDVMDKYVMDLVKEEAKDINSQFAVFVNEIVPKTSNQKMKTSVCSLNQVQMGSNAHAIGVYESKTLVAHKFKKKYLKAAMKLVRDSLYDGGSPGSEINSGSSHDYYGDFFKLMSDQKIIDNDTAASFIMIFQLKDENGSLISHSEVFLKPIIGYMRLFRGYIISILHLWRVIIVLLRYL